MSTRTVTLKLTSQRNLVRKETSARTFGELKKELSDQVSFNGMKVIERTNKVTLEADDAVLPATDFMLFLVPQKVKSGAVEKLDDIDQASYNDLRSHGSFLNKTKGANINLDGGTESLRKEISKYYQSESEPVNESVVAVEEARANVNQVFDKLVEAVKNAEGVDNTEYVIKTSMEDLDQEIVAIRSQLNI